MNFRKRGGGEGRSIRELGRSESDKCLEHKYSIISVEKVASDKNKWQRFRSRATADAAAVADWIILRHYGDGDTGAALPARRPPLAQKENGGKKNNNNNNSKPLLGGSCADGKDEKIKILNTVCMYTRKEKNRTVRSASLRS
jgi:hypothetical protein